MRSWSIFPETFAVVPVTEGQLRAMKNYIAWKKEKQEVGV